MKNFKFQSIAVILFIFTVLTSCSSDDDNTPKDDSIYKSAYVTEVVGPTTGKTNQELSYSVAFQVENGCGQFHQMTDVSFDKVEGYQVEVKYPPTCSTNVPEIKRTVYKLMSPNAPGTYYLRFAKSDTEFLVTTVVISNN
ncbi:hypothetical protein [Flavobacterium sp. 1355]|uniref:hypothetical protein n=1 Tax=Flavobacterium sp. 1355 TaxID=2806571 RepID=UPI001AEAB07B|nr:hypothetical protein [Flavobacterium sp. 1355]MBP1221582.1 putative membrane protein [Flavobacterium sp. 1355]